MGRPAPCCALPHGPDLRSLTLSFPFWAAKLRFWEVEERWQRRLFPILKALTPLLDLLACPSSLCPKARVERGNAFLACFRAVPVALLRG